MKKFDFKELDKNHLRIVFYTFFIIAFLILFEKIIGNIPTIGSFINEFFANIVDIMFPFIIGFAIAYLINPLVKFMENNLKDNIDYAKSRPRLTRAMCILATYFIFLGGCVWIILYLLPEVETSFISFFNNISNMSNYDFTYIIVELFDQFEFIDTNYISSIVDDIFKRILIVFQNVPDLINKIGQNIVHVGGLAFDFIMAIFIAFYFLYDKEKSLSYSKRVIYAITKDGKADRLLLNISRVNQIFQNFITGKALDSFIIAILAFVGFSLMKAPFPSVLALIIGITNMIPYFGPFIGGTPVVILSVISTGDPIIGVWATVFIIVLQQFDGNYLGPRILGNSVDLSPILIILAVVVGGALGGAVGMFIGVPVLATIKMFFSEYIDRKYESKFGADTSITEKHQNN